MSSSSSSRRVVFDIGDEEICYVQCGLCSSILMVSVPCSSIMSMAVLTVRCGHCTTLLSVKQPSLTTTNTSNHNQLNIEDHNNNNVITPTTTHAAAANKPSEKRQRIPSAYNCFIKEEIKRLKAENPEMPHKEAFSTAAKNWANFPPFECRRGDDEIDEESCIHTYELANSNNKVNIKEDADLWERKDSENSVLTNTSFQ